MKNTPRPVVLVFALQVVSDTYVRLKKALCRVKPPDNFEGRLSTRNFLQKESKN